MATYADLQPGNFYLLRSEKDTDIELISVLALTDKCMLLRSFGQIEEDFWKKRTDPIEEIVEELDYESASAVLSLYDEEEEEEWEEEEDE
ncbi:MAG: hypothetical protein MUE38_01110 [Flavihumibacter sp.]|jgi:hypothetical protein|nr:hypothetical protein [Flavihumibacter sp.]